MQIAFYKGTRPGFDGFYSRLVRFVDGGLYSHCELVFSDGLSASASYTDGGVRFKNIEYNPENWDILDISPAYELQARNWFQQNVGRPYDLRGNLRFVLWFVPHKPDGYFCSEAAAAALGLTEGYRQGPNGLAALVKSGVFK